MSLFVSAVLEAIRHALTPYGTRYCVVFVVGYAERIARRNRIDQSEGGVLMAL
jgi:hypothetical protein